MARKSEDARGACWAEGTPTRVRCRSHAAILALAVVFVACGSREVVPGETLVLRNAGVAVRCNGRRLPFGAIRGERIDRYGFRSPLGADCTFSLEVPEKSTFSFRVELDDRHTAPDSVGRVMVTGEIEGELRTLLDESLEAGRAILRTVDLEPGPTQFRLRVDTNEVPPHRASKAAWTDLRFETHAVAPPPPWPLPVADALEPFLATQPARVAGEFPPRRRLLVVGIDGASWDRLAPLLERGELPTLASLKARGRYGVLESSFVPESAMSWTTIRTGVGPGRNGVFTFQSPPTPRRSEWHLLGDRGLRSIVFAVPKVSVDRPLEGILIGGWTVAAGRFTQPSELREALLRAGYRPELHTLRNPGQFLEHMRLRTKIAKLLLERLDWDHAFVVYEYSDTAGHILGLDTPEWAEVQRGVDALLGELLASVDEDTTVLLVSDHGWGRYPRRLSIEDWLLREGFSDLTVSPPWSANIVSISPKDGFSAPDAETLDSLRQRLLALREESDGALPVRRVVRPEEIFPGPFAAASGVSLIVELDPRYLALRSKGMHFLAASKIEHHDSEGIYLLAGPGVQDGPGPRASVLDIAPTVLAFYGIRAPGDFGGAPLWDFGVVATGAPPTALYFDDSPGTATPAGTGQQESPEIEESLRALGYIE